MKSSNLGIYKKSFSLYYNGGEIWAEHLDSIDNLEDMKSKFDEDMVQIARPSNSAFLAINLDQSMVTEEFLGYILERLEQSQKPLQRVAFVGLKRKHKRYISRQEILTNTMIACIDNYEKAKEWLL